MISKSRVAILLFALLPPHRILNSTTSWPFCQNLLQPKNAKCVPIFSHNQMSHLKGIFSKYINRRFFWWVTYTKAWFCCQRYYTCKEIQISSKLKYLFEGFVCLKWLVTMFFCKLFSSDSLTMYSFRNNPYELVLVGILGISSWRQSLDSMNSHKWSTKMCITIRKSSPWREFHYCSLLVVDILLLGNFNNILEILQ